MVTRPAKKFLALPSLQMMQKLADLDMTKPA